MSGPAPFYTPPPLPPNESARQAAVHSLEIQKMGDPVLDSLCKLLSSLTKVQVVGVLIVDHDSQFFIASTGREASPGTVPRSQSICQYTFLPKLPSMFVVDDCLVDERFRSHPQVLGSSNEKPIRFFAGAPLITSEGYRIGAMCLMDSEPRSLTTAECGMLSNCAEMVMRRLERDHYPTVHRKRTGSLLRTLDNLTTGIMLCDTGNRGWPILHINEQWIKQTGLKLSDSVNKTVWDVFCPAPESEAQVTQGFTDLISSSSSFSLQMKLKALGDAAPTLDLVFQPAKVGSLGPAIQIPDSLPNPDGPNREMPYYFVLVSGNEPEGMERESSSKQALPGGLAAPEGADQSGQHGRPGSTSGPGPSQSSSPRPEPLSSRSSRELPAGEQGASGASGSSGTDVAQSGSTTHARSPGNLAKKLQRLMKKTDFWPHKD